ncbi:MAG: phosphate ABC transporter substrate-binding protein PstS [Candidatus Solibacter sp.]|jgi:phosphate transport system substrate-binding protein
MRTISVALMGLLVVAAAPFAAAQKLNACGATFPDPIYKKWFSVYGKANQGVQINYEANGSGGGVKGVTDGTVDFGASDMPMTDQELAAVKSGKILHFPTVLGAVVPIYNLPGVTRELKFSGPVLADIFLGTISKWGDPRIAKENPGVKLPNEDIVVVHRTDGSGTTFVWTDFLAKVSPQWKSKVGAAKSVSWPKGLGGAQSAGVTGLVKQNPNSISYVELLYALQNKIGYGQVKNSAGNFVKADVATVTEAAAGAAKNMPGDFRVSITNPPGKNAYPISTFTWLLIPSKFSDPAKAKQVKEMLHWVLTDGQVLCAGLSYAPLPQAVVTKEEKQIDAIH